MTYFQKNLNKDSKNVKNKLLLLGGSGLVGSRVVALLSGQFDLVAPTAGDLDVIDKARVEESLNEIKPALILYAAGFTNVDLAEERKEQTYALNVEAAKTFVEFTKKINTPFYYLSTDYVFDGKQSDRPYTEEDQPIPVTGVYAKSKREGELVVLGASPINCVIRLIMPFSAVYKRKFDIARLILDKLKRGEKVNGVVDQKVNPIFVDDLVWAINKILQQRAWGIYHIGATSFTTPYDFILEIARQFKLPEEYIQKTSFEEFSKTRLSKRPQHTWLDTQKFRNEFGNDTLHTIEEEIRLFKSQVD